MRSAPLWGCLVLPVLFGGCSGGSAEKTGDESDPPVDSDGDGLLDDEEISFGSDPNSADTDEDGLSDQEEFDLGADPNAIDSDGDTYSDGDEVATGHSPTDAEDRIYIGYWPYNPDKDTIVDPGFGPAPSSGGVLPHFVWLDQFGDELDIYDLGGQGKYTVLDVSGQWCYWCHELADWLEFRESDYDDMFADYSIIRDSIASGELQWVTAIDADLTGGPATEDTLYVWSQRHPIEGIPILLDASGELAAWLSGGGSWFWPSYLVLDENMEIVLYPDINNFGEHIFPTLTEMLESQ